MIEDSDLLGRCGREHREAVRLTDRRPIASRPAPRFAPAPPGVQLRSPSIWLRRFIRPSPFLTVGLFSAFVVLPVSGVAASAVILPADSRITAVTVFSDGAEITRNATVEVAAAGTIEVQFDHLPLSLLDKSVRVSGREIPARPVITVKNGDVKSVVAQIAFKTPGPHDLSLVYTVPDASWEPVYDAHLLLAEHGVQLDHFAVLQQTSGEDWSSVELTLSSLNADGSRSHEKALARTATGLGPVYVRPDSPDSRPPLAPAVSYRLSEPCSVASERSGQKMFVASSRLPFECESVVSGQPFRTFRTFRVTNSLASPVLGGTYTWLLDDRRLATQEIRTIDPGKVFTFMHEDKTFPTTRKLVNRYEDDGPLDKTWRINYELLLTVTNPLPTTENVLLVQHVPGPPFYGRLKEVVVTLITPVPSGRPATPLGPLEWNLVLAPGETREVPAKFSIEFLDMPIRKGHVAVGDLRVLDETASTPEAKPQK